MWLASSLACLAYQRSSITSWPSGCARLWLTGYRWTCFTATSVCLRSSVLKVTNNPHPLTDVTGSRRYICLTIPEGQMIENTGDIDYQQLYAQVLHELRVLKAPYWFNNDEVARIQELNLDYMAKKDMMEMIDACFLKPQESETGQMMSNTEVLGILIKAFPSLKSMAGLSIKLG